MKSGHPTIVIEITKGVLLSLSKVDGKKICESFIVRLLIPFIYRQL